MPQKAFLRFLKIFSYLAQLETAAQIGNILGTTIVNSFDI